MENSENMFYEESNNNINNTKEYIYIIDNLNISERGVDIYHQFLL